MFDVEVKASPPQEFKVNLDDGTFEGFPAAYGNIDDGGDRIVFGAGKHIAEANPTIPIFYGHGWLNNEPPVGKSLMFDERRPGLWSKGKMLDTAEGRDILTGMREGVLNAESIGYKALDWKMVAEKGEYVREIYKYELKEYSILPAGFAMNPQAVITAVKGNGLHIYDVEETKGVIGYVETPKADRGASWDGPGEVAKADVGELRAMCAWVDTANDDNKSAYKFPHHKAGGEHAVVFAALSAAMGRLNQASIPDADKRGVYAHIAKHYRDFGEEPPGYGKASHLQEEVGLKFLQVEGDVVDADTPVTVTHTNGTNWYSNGTGTLDSSTITVKTDVTGDQVPEKDYRELRAYVEKADPVSVLLDEAAYMHELAQSLKAEGREDEIREALSELDSASLLLKAITEVKQPEPVEDDIVALIKHTTEQVNEARRILAPNK